MGGGQGVFILGLINVSRDIDQIREKTDETLDVLAKGKVF
jgi:hypothetical protein